MYEKRTAVIQFLILRHKVQKIQ